MDPYQVLGCSPKDNPDVIKKAYRDLAKQHHPDNGGSKERMQEINAAYEQIQKGPAQQQDGVDIFDLMNDFWSNIRNMKFDPAYRQPIPTDTDENLVITLQIPLAHILKGADFKIDVNRRIQCPTCKGKGLLAVKKFCDACCGQGCTIKKESAKGHIKGSMLT